MTPREQKIAVPIVAALLLCLAAWWYGFQTAQSFEGISAMRTVSSGQTQRLGVVVNKALHILDDSGKRVARQELISLGLAAAPNDMDWTVDDSGQIEAWFFEDNPPRVRRCAWNEAALRLLSCTTAMSGPQLKVDAGSRAIHIAVDRQGDRIFIADARGQAVQEFDLAGKLIRLTPASLGLNFPNRLRYLGKDTLLIADNDNRRLVWLSVASNALFKEISRLGSGDHVQRRSGAGKVQDVAIGPDGILWMLATRQGQKDGDVLVFDAARKPVARAELPAGADPLIVDALGNSAVVADFSLVNLYRLGHSGEYLGEFGDNAFQSELAPLQIQAKRARWLQQGAGILGVGVVLLGLVLGCLYGEKPKNYLKFSAIDAARIAAAKPEAVFGTAGLRFFVLLEQGEAAKKKLRTQWVLVLLAIASLFAVWIYAFSDLLRQINTERPLSFQLSMAGLFLVISLTFGFFSRRGLTEPIALKIFESHVEVVKGSKRLSSAPLAEVLASPFQVLVGKKSVNYVQPTGLAKAPTHLFDQALVEKALLSRLPAKNLVSGPAFGWQQFKNQSLTTRVVTVFALTLALALQFWEMWKLFS